jgi:peptidoglycan/LPS O-acetylase OafA/YrhL
MRDVLAYRGLSEDVETALAALEQRFDAGAYQIVMMERNRRIAPFLGTTLPFLALGFVLVYLAQGQGWLPKPAPWAYAFFPLIFMAVIVSRLRPAAARDDQRLGSALKKWAIEAKKSGLT